jgi:hypothetical protein
MHDPARGRLLGTVASFDDGENLNTIVVEYRLRNNFSGMALQKNNYNTFTNKSI